MKFFHFQLYNFSSLSIQPLRIWKPWYFHFKSRKYLNLFLPLYSLHYGNASLPHWKPVQKGLLRTLVFLTLLFHYNPLTGSSSIGYMTLMELCWCRGRQRIFSVKKWNIKQSLITTKTTWGPLLVIIVQIRPPLDATACHRELPTFPLSLLN